MRIENVAAQRAAHVQMTRDQEEDRFAVGFIQIEPRQTGPRQFQTACDMIVWLGALAGVVKQQREIKQVRLFDFVEQFGIALIPFRLRFACRSPCSRR